MLYPLNSTPHSILNSTLEVHKQEQWEKSKQKTKIVETGKLKGEKEIKKTGIKLNGKLLWTVITVMLQVLEELSQCNDVASIN